MTWDEISDAETHLHITPHSEPRSNGAWNRSLQISEMIKEKAGLSYKRHSFKALSIVPRSRLPSLMLKGVLNAPRIPFPVSKLRGYLHVGHLLDELDQINWKSSGRVNVYWELNAGSYQAVGPLLRKYRPNRILAFPHNIESLVPAEGSASLFTGKRKMEWLKEELSLLGTADKIYTISRVDQQLLELLGLRAINLPYRPPLGRINWLKRIATGRAANNKGFFLIMGNVANDPTRDGILRQLEMVARMPSNLKFVVVGNDINGALGPAVAKLGNVRVLSSVSEDELEDILLQAIALWCHQPMTTGSLTRIAEMLYADVPVIANDFAARDYEGHPSVRIYTTSEQGSDFLISSFDGALGAYAAG